MCFCSGKPNTMNLMNKIINKQVGNLSIDEPDSRRE